MASLALFGSWTAPATAQPSPDALSRLLTLPAELRTEIFTHVLTLPAPQKLRYKCSHLHTGSLRRTRRTHGNPSWMAREDTKCSHSNANYSALFCPHYKARLPPIWEERKFWALILVSKQVYCETVGMVATLNTLSFEDVEDLRCFGIKQREIVSSLSYKSGAGVSHLHGVRSVEVSSGLVHVNDLRPMTEELVRMKDLENISLRAIHGDVRPKLELVLMLALIEAKKLPRLKSCKVEVTLDEEGPCKYCDRSGCPHWRFHVQRDVAVAKKINEALAEALAKRSSVMKMVE